MLGRVKTACFVLLVLTYLSHPGAAEEPKWGHVSGRFLWSGEIPSREPLRVTKDQTYFDETIEDESLVVNADNRGLANVLVYLLPDGDGLKIHPSYEDTANAEVELRFENGRFVPHMILLRTSQTLVQTNVDGVAHNAKIDFLRNVPK